MYQVKGVVVRTYVKYLEREGRMAAVLERLSPAEAATLRNPPLPGTWVDAMVLENVSGAIFELDGLAALRRLSRTTINEGMLPTLRPMIQGIMRLIGVSPSSLFSRLNDVVKTSCKGIDYQWTSTGDRSGKMEVRYDTTRAVPAHAFITGAASLEAVLELCSVKGVVSEPELLGPNRGRYTIRW
jgi:hypothetical protein